MTPQQLIERRTACAAKQQALLEQHARLTAATTELVAQINALIGRQQELDELIALVEAPEAG